jgi:hypothetical protein
MHLWILYPLLRSESIWPDSEKKSPEFDHIGPKSKKQRRGERKERLHAATPDLERRRGLYMMYNTLT